LGAHVIAIQHNTRVADGAFDEIAYCDLQDKLSVEFVVNEGQPEYVFHLASQAIVGEASEESFATNAMGTVNLLSSLRDSQMPLHGVIVASTDKVYGRHKYLPYDEQFPLWGTEQIYETSKNCEDIIAQAYAHTFGLPIGITRFGNVYGPGDFHWSRIVPGTIAAYLRKSTPVIRSDGQFYRDYVYIDDVVSGYIKLAEHRSRDINENPMIYNFGTGIPCRVLDLVGMISSHFTNAAAPEIMYEAKQEIEKQYVDSTKARNELDWIPQTKLVVGIQKTVDWYKDWFDVISD
jgi:CDP-glucose 4,6-dehydratase